MFSDYKNPLLFYAWFICRDECLRDDTELGLERWCEIRDKACQAYSEHPLEEEGEDDGHSH